MTTNSICIETDTGTLFAFASGSWSAVGGGGGGAPTTASYVTLGTNATLTSERVLTAGTDISLTDAGAGSTLTVDIGTNVITTSNTKTLTNKTIAAGSNTITGIVDANITAHTTSKITTSSKSLLNSAIVYNDQTNSLGDFNQVFKDNRLLINNPADTFAYTIIGAAIAANRNITLPLLTGNDTAVTEAFTQTLTNKTLDTATNTITGIADTNITAHTTSKITTTSKSLLNSSIVYTDQANALGDFNFTLKDNRLLINNPADTFNYTIIAAAIAANRTITLPLLTGNDIMVTEAFTQTLTNKTLAAGSNTITGIVDANIGSHTSTKITITDKTHLPSTAVYTDQANTYTSGTQLFQSSNIKVRNPADTFSYTIVAGAIGADRSLTLPTLTGTDTIAVLDLAQTLTNKTLAAGSNTITGIVDTNIGSHTTTKITTTSKSLLNSAILYNDVDNTLNAHFLDITKITAPSSPAANDLRLYVDTTDTHLKHKNNSGTVIDLTAAAAGGGEANTYSTVGTGAAWTLTKSGVDLPFRSLIMGSSKLSLTTNTNDLTIDVAQANLSIAWSQLTSIPSTIVKTDQTNTFGAFNQIFPSTRLRINDSTTPANYIIATSAIAADRTITLPLMTGNDVLVLLDLAQTLTNKTIVAGSNTITGIVDANIGSHTTTKITTTAKGQLNSSIMYTDQANALGDFNFTLKDNRLLINNPADTFAYTIIAAAIAANRSITLPLLTGNDTAVTEAFTQTLTNKTLDAASNTVSNIVDANIGTHTTTKISTTNKSLLNSSIAYTDAAITLGDFNFTLKDNRLIINNPADTFNYTIIAAAIAANRTITLPLLTGNDVMVTEAFTQTLTNKTLAAGSNTITGLVDANLSAHTSTKVTITAKGQLNSAIVYNDATNTFGAFAQIFPSSQLKIQNPGATFNYIVAGSAIAADRTLTLPLLTGNDIVVTEAFGQTLTNKTMVAGSNTITGIVDANISAHTTSKITTTSKSLLNTAIVYNDADNAMGAHFIDITKMTAPSNPGSANDLRLYVDTADTHLKHRNSAGTVVDITAATGGGGGDATLAGTQTFTGAKSFDLQITEKEIAAPSSPAAGYQALYIDSTSHKLNRKNSSGTVTQIEPQFTEAKGVSTQTQSSASNTGFTIAHGLGSSPSWVSCIGSSVDADSDFSYTSDSTNITVIYPFPPPTGTSNIIFNWRVAA